MVPSVWRTAVLATVAVLLLSAMLPLAVHGEVSRSRGQTVYVPAYSHVYTGNRGLAYNLAATLCVRNVDMSAPITVTGIDYHDSAGKLVRRMVTRPLVLAPLASTSIFIKEKDTSGGFGASFIVKWHSTKEVNTPIIECLLIGAYSGLGISFVSPGREIR